MAYHKSLFNATAYTPSAFLRLSRFLIKTVRDLPLSKPQSLRARSTDASRPLSLSLSALRRKLAEKENRENSTFSLRVRKDWHFVIFQRAHGRWFRRTWREWWDKNGRERRGKQEGVESYGCECVVRVCRAGGSRRFKSRHSPDDV